jgi:hypothetical protein
MNRGFKHSSEQEISLISLKSRMAKGDSALPCPVHQDVGQKGMRMISYSSDSAMPADALATGVAEIKKSIPRG